MPAKSQIQQQAAGIALAAKKGDIKVKDLKGAAKNMYDSMTLKQLEDFAKTKHEELPKKTKKIDEYVCPSLEDFLNESDVPLSTLYDVILEELQTLGISYEQADFALGTISDSMFNDFEQKLEFNEMSITDIAQEVYKIAFNKDV